jgi:hypothetical protein
MQPMPYILLPSLPALLQTERTNERTSYSQQQQQQKQPQQQQKQASKQAVKQSSQSASERPLFIVCPTVADDSCLPQNTIN